MTAPVTEDGLPRWAVVSERRRAHVQRVVALVGTWADAMTVEGTERYRWLRAAWLHDALRDAPLKELLRLAPGEEGPEELLHGPAAAARAAVDGEQDRGILEAVRHHSIGSPAWDMPGIVLYCADFLEPGRRFGAVERAELARRFPDEPRAVLREVARWRLQRIVESGWRIPELTWRFWNGLADPRP